MTCGPGDTVEIAGRKAVILDVRYVPPLSDSRETKMPNVYIEAHPRGRPEGSAVQDFVVEDHADHVLAAFKRSSGRGRTTIRLSLPACGISTTKTPITGRAASP